MIANGLKYWQETGAGEKLRGCYTQERGYWWSLKCDFTAVGERECIWKRECRVKKESAANIKVSKILVDLKQLLLLQWFQMICSMTFITFQS